jgi:hypothetical protein
VALSGAPRFVPERPATVRDGEPADLRWMDAVARRARGAPYAAELALWLRFGGRLHAAEGRGFAVGLHSMLMVLAADDEDVAADLLRSFLATAPRGAELGVHHVPAGHDWAIRVGLDAGLALSPTGALFVRGEPGHLAPYLPNGAFL